MVVGGGGGGALGSVTGDASVSLARPLAGMGGGGGRRDGALPPHGSLAMAVKTVSTRTSEEVSPCSEPAGSQVARTGGMAPVGDAKAEGENEAKYAESREKTRLREDIVSCR